MKNYLTPTSFRLTQKDKDLVKDLAESMDLNASQVIRLAIESLWATTMATLGGEKDE